MNKKIIYYLLIILLIMSIICYFLNIENFAGSLRRQLRLQRRREQRLINIAKKQKLMAEKRKLIAEKKGLSQAEKKGLSQVEINIQDVAMPVSKILFFGTLNTTTITTTTKKTKTKTTTTGTETILTEIITTMPPITSSKTSNSSPVGDDNILDDESYIKNLEIYSNNQKITNSIKLNNTITFKEASKIKKISFEYMKEPAIDPSDNTGSSTTTTTGTITTTTTPITTTTITTTYNLSITMQFLDSNNKIINEIITEPRKKFNFIFPPYTEKEATSRASLKNNQNAKLMSLTKTTLDAFILAQSTTLSAIANLAKYNAALKKTTDNINNVQINLATCNKSIAKFKVAKIEFSKNFDTVIKNLKEIGEYKNYIPESAKVNLVQNDINIILSKERILSSFAIKNLYITDIDDSRLTSDSFVTDDGSTTLTFEPTNYISLSSAKPKIENALSSDITYSPALPIPLLPNDDKNYPKDYYTSLTSPLNKNIKLIYKLNTPTILKRISFSNGYSQLTDTITPTSKTDALTIKGVTIRCLDISGAVIDDMLISEILDTVTLASKQTVINDIKNTMLTRDNLDSAYNTLTNGLTELENSVKVPETSSETSVDAIADNSSGIYLGGTLDSTLEGFAGSSPVVPRPKNILENAVSTAKSAELFTANNAIKAANNQVNMAIDELKYALSFSEYNNDYVSDNYIILIKEQQKKTLIPALKGSKNAIQSLEDILYKTKLQSSISTHPKLQELKKLDSTGTILLKLLNQ